MRDINRIRPSMERLMALWYQVPDQRLGQFISNLLGIYYQETGGHDPFFPEEEEFLSVLENYFNKE